MRADQIPSSLSSTLCTVVDSMASTKGRRSIDFPDPPTPDTLRLVRAGGDERTFCAEAPVCGGSLRHKS